MKQGGSKEIGNRLKTLRDIHNISLIDLANKTGIAQCTLVQIENGRYPLSANALVILSKFYNVSCDYILGLTDLKEGSYKMEVRDLYTNSYEQYLKYSKESCYIPGDTTRPYPVWPYNLIEYCGIKMDAPLSDVQMEGLQEVIDHKLTVKEGVVICAYFIKGMTLGEIAEQFDLTRERIRQIALKACRKIRHPALTNMIKYGKDYAKINREMQELDQKLFEISQKREMIAEFEEIETEYGNDPHNMTLDDLDLSVRSYNCIKRHFIYCHGVKPITVNDIIDLFQTGRIIKVRNLGRKSFEEIESKLLSIGITKEELELRGEAV